jgi:hypothetical protein
MFYGFYRVGENGGDNVQSFAHPDGSKKVAVALDEVELPESCDPT